MNRKYNIAFILLTILFLASFSSASAATCERVDTVGGDYYYQCDGVQITQTAVTMVGDTITNFTNSDTDASWDFYDGLNDTATSYLSAIPIIFYQTVGTVDIPEEWLGEKTINITVPGTYNFTISSTGDSCYNFPYIRIYAYNQSGTETELAKVGGCTTCDNPAKGFRLYDNWNYQYSYTFPSAGTYKLKYHSEQRYDRGGSDTCTKVDYVNTIFTFSSPLVVYQDMSPTVSLAANPSTVDYNGSSILSWSSQNTNSCSASWTTSTSTSGSKTLSNLTSTQDYSISCTDSVSGGGTARAGHSSVIYTPAGPRSAHTSVLYNGNIYVWGGDVFENDSVSNTLEIYNIASGTWSLGSSGGTARANHASVLVNNKIYSFGGEEEDGSYLSIVDIYDIASNTWSTGNNNNQARAHLSAVASGDKVYVWGGGDGNNLYKKLQIYDTTNNSWVTKNDTTPPTARRAHTSVLYNGNIYVWGGRGAGEEYSVYYNTLEIYNIASGTWSLGSSGGTARANHASVVVGDKIYSFGGFADVTTRLPVGGMDIYDIGDNTWSTIISDNLELNNISAVVSGNKIYASFGASPGRNVPKVMNIYDITSGDWLTTERPGGKIYSWGGYSNVTDLETIDIYDIVSNTWSTGRSGGTARNGHSSVIYNGKIYSWGGLSSGNYLNSLDIYDIASDTWSNGMSGGTKRTYHSSVIYEGKIYIWGGVGSAENFLNSLDIYDIVSNTWSTGKWGGTARAGHSSESYNGKIYMWGGISSAYNILNSLDIYDIASDTWSTGKWGGTARRDHSSELYNGKIYSWGGAKWLPLNSVYNTTDIYDIATESWSVGATGGIARREHSSVLYNNKIYSWGGTNSGSLNTLDVYNIANDSWLIGDTFSATTTVTVRTSPVPPPPSPPVTFTIQSTNPSFNTGCGAEVNLDWTSVDDTDHYQIFRATNIDIDLTFSGLDSTSTTLYTDTSAVNGNTYYYRIKACNVLNECSGYSSSTSAVVIPPASDCDDPSLTTYQNATSTCSATQTNGPLPSDGFSRVFVNKQMQWKVDLQTTTGIDIPTTATTTWQGTNTTLTLPAATTTLNKLYTTVGLKNITATSTWKVGTTNYTAVCSTSTNVIFDGGNIIEI